MKKRIIVWQGVGYVFVLLLGTLLHFLYDWTDNSLVALFSAVNESTWEHMKLVFFPMMIFAVVQSFYFSNNYDCFWCIKLKGAVFSLTLIPVLFYTLNGVYGTTPAWVNIGIFVVSAGVGLAYETFEIINNRKKCKADKASILGFVLIALSFFLFTFITPEIPLFIDPIDGSYGL